MSVLPITGSIVGSIPDSVLGSRSAPAAPAAILARPLARRAAKLHRQWLSFWWDSYSREAHAGLAQIYVDDERYTAYYGKDEPGTASFLRRVILIYTRTKAWTCAGLLRKDAGRLRATASSLRASFSRP